jgi:nucleoside-diphosphate-sugar epimerase
VTVLVTGATGLVGSHVVEQLQAAGHPVRAFSGDVTDPADWTRAIHGGVQAIVHTAALVAQSEPFERFVAVNVGGTTNAAQAAARAGARLVHLSSVAVYGREGTFAAGGQGHRVDEDFPFAPIAALDFYARSKRMAEESLWPAVRETGVPTVVLRPNVIYGERDRLFSSRVARVLRRTRGLCPVAGRGGNVLSCVYAGNVAAAVLLALDPAAPHGRCYHVTNDGGITQREFLDVFATALGFRPRALRIPMPLALAGGYVVELVQRLRHPGRYPGVGRQAARFAGLDNPFTSRRAETELGWKPVCAPREAVAKTARWFRAPA